jgi:hypothetical protein
MLLLLSVSGCCSFSQQGISLLGQNLQHDGTSQQASVHRDARTRTIGP